MKMVGEVIELQCRDGCGQEVGALGDGDADCSHFFLSLESGDELGVGWGVLVTARAEVNSFLWLSDEKHDEITQS